MSLGPSGANSQPNGQQPSARLSGENLAPAVDCYSFYNRLCELFPDIHPPQLQRVFDECGRDFLRTIDNVLYARRFRKSIMTQMSKFRSQQRTQMQNNPVPSSQQLKDEQAESHAQAQDPQQSKPEKQPMQSPKVQLTAKNTTSNTSRRSRILAYRVNSSTNVNSSRNDTSPKHSLTAHDAQNSLKQGIRKSSTPPPNVCVHPVEVGQQFGGNGDTSFGRKFNQNYLFPYKRPIANTYGMLPQPSTLPSVSFPPCAEPNSFGAPLPTPSSLQFRAPQQFAFSDCSPKVPTQMEQQFPHVSLGANQQQQEQNKQQVTGEERTGINQQRSHLQNESNLEVPQQRNENESDEWALLLRNILDPLHSVDSRLPATGVVDSQQMSASAYDAVNDKKRGNGPFMFNLTDHSRFPFVTDVLGDNSRQNCDKVEEAITAATHQVVSQRGKSSKQESQSEKMNATGLNSNDKSGRHTTCSATGLINSSPSAVLNVSRKPQVIRHEVCGREHNVHSTEESSSSMSSDRDKSARAKQPDFSPSNQLIMDTDSWIQSIDHEEQVHDAEVSVQSDGGGFEHVLGM